jgi:hypothetical protein
MNGLKLFVVGETSGNPDDWPAGFPRILVLAAGADEALRVADSGYSQVAEVTAKRAVVLCRAWFNEKAC